MTIESNLDQEFKPLVTGAPRTGFSLLINVISHLYALTSGKQSLNRRVLKAFTDVAGWEISRDINTVFEKHNITDKLIYNTNFRNPVGGPSWLDPEKPERACFRKYIGVKGLGDFTLITTHPREILDNYEVVHSHYHPKLWLEQPFYQSYSKFSSIRNPVSTLNSSCFSINALTSEYIQKFIPTERDNDGLRQHLALYKLTDMEFFNGLIKPLKNYLEEFMQCKSDYTLMRWEDLITSPVETILSLSKSIDVDINKQLAISIWDDIKYKNLTAAHKHNYRIGHGKINGWRKSLTNEHLSLMREQGIDKICRELGYGEIIDIDEKAYTDFQNKISTIIKKGEIFNDYPDRDLFNFAFNKSNLDSDKFTGFKRYDWREHTRIERSCFTDEALLFEVWDVVEDSVKRFNKNFQKLCSERYCDEDSTKKIIKKIFSETGDYKDQELKNRTLKMMEDKIIDPPRLILKDTRWSIVSYGGKFYGIPRPLGAVDIANEIDRNYTGILSSCHLSELTERIKIYTSGLSYWLIYLSAKYSALLVILHNSEKHHV